MGLVLEADLGGRVNGAVVELELAGRRCFLSAGLMLVCLGVLGRGFEDLRE